MNTDLRLVHADAVTAAKAMPLTWIRLTTEYVNTNVAAAFCHRIRSGTSGQFKPRGAFEAKYTKGTGPTFVSIRYRGDR